MNIAEILKNKPENTKLYSPIFGEVKLVKAHKGGIEVLDKQGIRRIFFSNGTYSMYGECMLFPSKENNDWNKFVVSPFKDGDIITLEVSKFDVNTLEPFDKILVRDSDYSPWRCAFFDSIIDNREYKFRTTLSVHSQCIPYNSNTRHLAGKKEHCPEYYKTW